MSQKVISNFLDKMSSRAEKEVENLLKAFLPGTPFAGHAKAVGGYPRDEYLKEITKNTDIEPKDLDIVVSPTPGHDKGAEDLTHLIHKNFPDNTTTPHQMGEAYPIWQITFRNGDIKYKGEMYKTDGAVIEFADTMKETYPDSGSRQRKVEPGTLEEDVERRDFTTNMLLKDLTTGEIEDLTGTSKKDIEQGILRGHPKVSLDTMFSNDSLRLIRLCRFSAKYGWKVPRYVLRAVQRNAHRIDIVSSERIMGELKKVMEIGKLRHVIKLFSITGLLKHILPEVEALRGVQQPKEQHGEGDVYRHTLKVLENTAPGVESQMAALLHDIGKPSTTKFIKDKITSYDHHIVGAEIALAIMKRLKFEKDTQNKVKALVENHMRPHFLPEDPSPKALRRFIKDVGDELVDAILDLAHADALGRIPSRSEIPDLRERIDKVRKEAPTPKKPVLNGGEIIELLGLKGIAVGVATKMLEDETIDNPSITKDEAKEFLKSHADDIKKQTEEEIERQKKKKEEQSQKRKKARKIASEFLSRQL